MHIFPDRGRGLPLGLRDYPLQHHLQRPLFLLLRREVQRGIVWRHRQGEQGSKERESVLHAVQRQGAFELGYAFRLGLLAREH